MNETTKTKYNLWKERYPQLPDFQVLENLKVEVSDTDNFLSDIRENVLGKLEYHLNIIAPLIGPEQNVFEMYESTLLTDIEKIALFDIIKKIRHYQRKSLVIDLDSDEEAEVESLVEMIAFATHAWESLKHYYARLAAGWEKGATESTYQEYFG